MSLVLRSAAAEDLDALARLHALCFPLEAWDAAALAGILAMRGAHARLATASDDRMLGFLIAILHEDEAEILTLGVHPAERDRGIGRSLLDDLFRRARDAQLGAVVLEVAADNDAGLGLYRSAGFHAVGRRRGYYRRGADAAVDAWLLRRHLA